MGGFDQLSENLSAATGTTRLNQGVQLGQRISMYMRLNQLCAGTGTRATQALSNYVFDQQVTVEWTKVDRYGRTVGKILNGEQDLNLAWVRDGMCQWYRKYAGQQTAVDQTLYEAAETKTKTERAGLWSDPDPVPP